MQVDNRINDVRPFRALHYNPATNGNIGLCLSQPYDVINPEQLESYLKQHENNIVRLTLPKTTPEDTETDNRYTRAHKTLNEWRKNGIIDLTDHPSFWVYEQEFALGTGETKKVRGYIGLVRLADYESLKILPHEKVLKKPVEDRIRLTRETNTQFEYIWGIYRDRKCEIDTILEQSATGTPIIDFNETDKGVKHRFWKLSDASTCKRISDVMSDCKIYIADGHHRYQTMLTIRDELRAAHESTNPDAPYEFIMMYLTNSEHEGLTILPTHRMLHDLASKEWAVHMKKVEDYFDVLSIDFNAATERNARQLWISSISAAKPGEKKFGLYLKGASAYSVLTLKNESAYGKLVPGSNSEAWNMLDVNIVNFLLLKEIFGISEEELSLGEKIKYVVDPNEAIEKVNKGGMDAAVILNSTKLGEVLEIADNREIMPRKSTFFYPKPLSGLVMYSMNEKDA